jgi:heat shock protein HtpX
MVRTNRRKTILLLMLLTTVLLLAGRLVAGRAGMLLALVAALAVVVAACWFSERLALWMAAAQEVSPAEQPELHRLVRQVAERCGLPSPRVYLIEEPAPNAFAVGRDPRHAAIALTTGLVMLLEESEGATIVAHELAHVENGDTLLAGTLATVVFALTLPLQLALHGVQALTDVIQGYAGGHDGDEPGYARRRLMLYLAPVIAPLLQLALPRRCEYAADRTAARLAGNPLLLASALQKIEQAIPLGPPLDADPAMHHLFIVNPSPEQTLGWLFSTQPPLDERVRRLRQLAGTPA